MRSKIGRMLAAVIAAVLTLLAAPATQALAVAPAESLSTSAYDCHHHPSPVTGVFTERGPPAVHHHLLLTTHDAVGWSRGASARPDTATTPVAYTYDHFAWPVYVDNATATTSGHAEAIHGGLSPFQRAGVAAKGSEAVADGAKVLKGPIADAIPKNLPQQMALDAAKAGQGRQIMGPMGDAPRLVANYGEGEWVKMQYVLRGNDSNVTVHYFRNLDSGMDMEFKFP